MGKRKNSKNKNNNNNNDSGLLCCNSCKLDKDASEFKKPKSAKRKCKICTEIDKAYYRTHYFGFFSNTPVEEVKRVITVPEILNDKMVTLDGRVLKGGGQTLRVAVPMSIHNDKPLQFNNIRVNRRPTPGIKPQHYIAINMLEKLGILEANGNYPTSGEVLCTPLNKDVDLPDTIEVDVHTAGSVSLVLQCLLPVFVISSATLTPSEVITKPITIKCVGGTHVKYSPMYDFFKYALGPTLSLFGVNINSKLLEYGTYPTGGGIVEVEVESVQSLTPIDLTLIEHPAEHNVHVCVYLFGDITGSVGEDIVNSVEGSLIDAYDDINLTTEIVNRPTTKGTSFGLVIRNNSGPVPYFSSKIVTKSPTVELVNEMVDYCTSDYITCYDNTLINKHLQDQLLIFMALSPGTSKFRTVALTEHTLACIDTIQAFTGEKFTFQHISDNETIITYN